MKEVRRGEGGKWVNGGFVEGVADERDGLEWKGYHSWVELREVERLNSYFC